MSTIIRQHAEQQFQHELQLLAAHDQYERPLNWQLSPRAVLAFISGTQIGDTLIEAKYFGARHLIETCIATLASDRALLLLGIPGTAKTWLSELLAAAISGDSTRLVQGTSGTVEEALKYGWNYARLLTEGPTEQAIVPSPIMTAMRDGSIARVEELTRMASDVQDTLISILSEKTIAIPELGHELQAISGFNLIATANNRDKGINDLSSALKRRFNTVILPVPETFEEEVHIVETRARAVAQTLHLPPEIAIKDEVQRVVQIFRELRSGRTTDSKTSIKQPTATLSPAEAISVITHGMSMATWFGDGQLSAAHIANSLNGTIVKEPSSDSQVWSEYIETVIKRRPQWQDLADVL